MNNKFWIGGVIGFIAFFLLGYVVYVLALGTTLQAHTMPGVSREEMDWVHLLLGNIAYGFAISYILSKSNTSSFGGGATTCLITGLLIILGADLISFATTKIISDTTGLFLDVAAFGFMFAVVGGIVGAYRGMGAKQ
ncbi:MAG TPA: hypothetical protein VFG10_10460 [Saprospiraceae bacterium]|nr:hypothetical protein [Saprospiraceae bacterium]